MPVFALGFSVRALVESVLQVVPNIVAIDHFRDHDLCQAASNCVQIPDWGSRNNVAEDQRRVATIIKQLGTFPTSHSSERAPLLLGGGTENWPILLEALTGHFCVLGPSNIQMQAIRSLELWLTASETAGIGFPKTVLRRAPDEYLPVAELAESFENQRKTSKFLATSATAGKNSSASRLISSDELVSHSGHWIRKSLQSAGGLQVERVDRELTLTGGLAPLPLPMKAEFGRTHDASSYYQKEVQGRSIGVTCLLNGNETMEPNCTVLGATESFGPRDWPGPSEFIYRGSWGPVSLTAQQTRQVKLLAEYVFRQTGLFGWLQADFVEDASGKLWLLELNPRWTAGMEILSLAGLNPVAEHLQAWGVLSPGDRKQATLPPREHAFGKAVLYADQDVQLTESFVQRLQSLSRASYADIPSTDSIGTVVRSGHPLLTVRARVDRLVSDIPVKEKLLQKLSRLRCITLRAWVETPKQTSDPSL